MLNPRTEVTFARDYYIERSRFFLPRSSWLQTECRPFFVCRSFLNLQNVDDTNERNKTLLPLHILSSFCAYQDRAEKFAIAKLPLKKDCLSLVVITHILQPNVISEGLFQVVLRGEGGGNLVPNLLIAL